MVSICSVFKWLGWPVFICHSKTKPFGIWPLLDHLNTKQVQYSDPHCILLDLEIKNLKFFQVKNICVRREDTASDCVSAALKVLDLSDLRTGKNLFTVTNHMDISSTGLDSGAPKSNPSKSGIIRN